MKSTTLLKLFLILALCCSLFPQQAIALEMSEGVAIVIPIKDTAAKPGHIVSFTEEGYLLSSAPYDPKMFGVITDNPSVIIEDANKEATEKAVISSGKTIVLVSTSNGSIQKGNLITSSQIPGVGQKATADGYIIGTALEGYSNNDKNQTGSILISLNPGFYSSPATLRTNLLTSLKANLTAPFVTPGNSLRYVLAGMSVLIALIAAMRFFGRVTASGVEALGRNPLAKSAILAGMVLNLGLSVGIMIAGIAIAYLILVL